MVAAAPAAAPAAPVPAAAAPGCAAAIAFIVADPLRVAVWRGDGAGTDWRVPHPPLPPAVGSLRRQVQLLRLSPLLPPPAAPQTLLLLPPLLTPGAPTQPRPAAAAAAGGAGGVRICPKAAAAAASSCQGRAGRAARRQVTRGARGWLDGQVAEAAGGAGLLRKERRSTWPLQPVKTLPFAFSALLLPDSLACQASPPGQLAGCLPQAAPLEASPRPSRRHPCCPCPPVAAIPPAQASTLCRRQQHTPSARPGPSQAGPLLSWRCHRAPGSQISLQRMGWGGQQRRMGVGEGHSRGWMGRLTA